MRGGSSLGARVARVGAFALVLSAGSWAFWAHGRPSAPAPLALGATLAAHAPPADGGDALVINGVHTRTLVAAYDQELNALLPRLRAACDSTTADPREVLLAVERERVAATSDAAHVIRDDRRAMVTCAGRHDDRLMIYAEETEGGVAVRVLSSDRALAPIGEESSADAPGSDLEGVPRPAGARRLLSAFSADRSYGLVQLVLPDGDLDSQWDAYAGALERAGFEVRELPGDDPDQRTLVADRGPRRVIAILDAGVTDRTMATLLDQG